MEVIPAVIFAYSGDAIPLRECVRALLACGLQPVVVDDDHAPLPRGSRGWLEHSGCEYIRSTFPRNGNLNGTHCAANICYQLHLAAERHDTRIAIKIDADTVLLRPETYTERTTGISSAIHERRAAFGCIYSIERDTAGQVAQTLFDNRDDISQPEDLTIWAEIIANHPHQMIEFCKDGGAFSAVPESFDPLDCFRFSALTFGNRPRSGWIDRQMQIYTGMKKLNDYNSTLAKSEQIH